jgi:hypothetical protein
MSISRYIVMAVPSRSSASRLLAGAPAELAEAEVAVGLESAPQDGQVETSGAAHWPQNFMPAGFSAWQCRHFTSGAS